MTWLTLLLPASLICCRSPRTCCQGGGRGSKLVSAQLFSMMLTAASGHRYCKVLAVRVFLLLKTNFCRPGGLGRGLERARLFLRSRTYAGAAGAHLAKILMPVPHMVPVCARADDFSIIGPLFSQPRNRKTGSDRDFSGVVYCLGPPSVRPTRTRHSK